MEKRYSNLKELLDTVEIKGAEVLKEIETKPPQTRSQYEKKIKKLELLAIEAMKGILYGPTEEQIEIINTKRRQYAGLAARMHKDNVQKNYRLEPGQVVKRDEMGLICRDREAIAANAEWLVRHYTLHPEQLGLERRID